MDFRSYLQRRISDKSFNPMGFGSLTGNALTNRLNSISLFSAANLDQLKNIDISKLLEGEVNPDATADEQALGDIISALMEMDEIKEIADTNGDGELSAEEATAFLSSIMGNDGDAANFSIEDIEAVMKNMNIDLEKVAEKALAEIFETENTEEAEKVEEEQHIQQPQQVQNSNAGGGVQPTMNQNANKPSTEKTEDTAPKTPEDFEALIKAKEAEIETINSNAEAEIQEQQNAKAEAMKEKGVSEAQQTEYQNKENALNEKISNTENTISDKEKDISDWKSTISSNNNYISSLDSQIQSNKSKLSSISDEDEDAATKRSDIQSKITALEDEKEKVKAENDELQKKVNGAEKDVNDLKNNAIPKYEQEKANLLSSMSANGRKLDVSDFSEYDDKIAEIKQKRDEDVQKIRAEIQDLQVQLKDVQAKDTRNSFIRENSAETPLFDPNLEISTQYITDGDMPYMLIGPKDADPNEELPVLVYLHGMGEVGKGEQGLYSAHGPGGIVPGWDLQNFNGYIICPQLASGSWENGTAESQLRALMDNFQENHNTGKSVIMGASLGGSGAVYMANQMGSEYFDEAVVLSGYRGGVSNIQIPVTGYVGNQDDPKSINIMRGQFGSDLQVLNATHGTLPKTLFSADADGDGCSDFLQKLFAKK